MNSNTIKVFDITQSCAVDRESGRQLYKLICFHLKDRNPIVLDFSEVRVFNSIFFSAAIANLYKDFTPSDLQALIKIESLPSHSINTLQIIVDRAKDYYRKTDFSNLQ